MKNGASSDMAVEAIKGLLEKKGLDPLEIDLDGKMGLEMLVRWLR